MECSKGCKSVTIILAVLLAGALGYIAYMKAPCCQGASGPADANDVVIATVGGNDVWLSEVVAFHDANPQLKNIPIDAVYKEIMNYIVESKALTLAAEKAGVKDTEQFKKAMKDAYENVLRSIYVETEVAKNVTDEKLQALYAQFVKENPGEDEVRASHILVESEKDAKAIIKSLNKGGDFVAIAKEKSKDANGTNGGDLGYFKKSAMVPEFADAAFSMKVGEVSQKPVKTMFGWHIVKVTDKRKSAPASFEQVKDTLKMREAQNIVPQIVTKAKADANIDLKPEAYKNNIVSLEDPNAKAEAPAPAAETPAPATEAPAPAASATETPAPEIEATDDAPVVEEEEVEIDVEE